MSITVILLYGIDNSFFVIANESIKDELSAKMKEFLSLLEK